MLRRLAQNHPRALATAFAAVLLALASARLLAPGSRTGTALVRESFDWSQALLPQINFSNAPIALVYLDLDSYLREKQNPAQPWNRELHAQLLRRLTGAGARAVVFDIIFGAPGADAAADRGLIAAMRANGRVVLAAEISRSSRNTSLTAGYQALQLSLPDKAFLAAAAGWGVANANMDNDFIVRRQFNEFPNLNEPSLAFATARMLGLVTTNASPPNWLRYYGKPLTLPHVSYSAALRTDEVGDDFFHGKIILIGARPMAGTFLERKDEFRSPLTAWGDRELFMPAVEVHATQLMNLLRNDSLKRFSILQEFGALLLTAVIFSWLLFRFRPLPSAVLGILSECVVFGLAAWMLVENRIWFPWLIVGAVQIPGALAASVLFQSLEWYRQKKKFEAQRRTAELKIREQAALIEKAQDAILVLDLADQIIYANPSAEKLYGWNAAELRENGAAKKIFFFDETRFLEAKQAALARGEWLGELEQLTRGQKKIIVTSRVTLIRDEAGSAKSLLFINTDVTEKKRLELEALRAQRLDSIGALAGGMAHDLNNSLAPVLLGLQLLRQQQPDAETGRMLSVMENNTHRSADMVKQVLLFSRGRENEKALLSLGNLVGELERIVRQTFPKAINVAAMAPADLWPVLGNATQLHQVLLNLCVNARDAMPAGGELTLAADNVELTAAAAAQMPQAQPGKFVMLIVADTGTGIAPEIVPRLFEPFFTTKPAGSGTGLGLSTTARIIEQHGGFIDLKSELDRGTSFEIYLPAAAPTVMPADQNETVSLLPAGNGELILVVDDEQSVREMISLGLTAQGYQVVTCANGLEAIALLEQRRAEVQLILLDDDMPVMNGRTARPRLQAISPNAPIIFMSGEVAGSTNQDAPKTLNKPFEFAALLKLLAREFGEEK